MDLLVTDAARVDRRGVRVLWVEDHWLVGWIDLLRGHGEGAGPAHTGVARARVVHVVARALVGTAHPGVVGAGPAHAGMARARAALPMPMWALSAHARVGAWTHGHLARVRAWAHGDVGGGAGPAAVARPVRTAVPRAH